MKRFLLLALTAAALAAPAGAHAAVPCRDKIYNEWYSTGKISTSYPVSCYHDALRHIPSDAQVYSNLGSDIKAALQVALSGSGPSVVGRGLTSRSTTGETKAAVTTKTADGRNTPVASGSLTSGSSSGIAGIPVPIFVLGAIALLLAAAGAVGTGVKRYRDRSAS